MTEQSAILEIGETSKGAIPSRTPFWLRWLNVLGTLVALLAIFGLFCALSTHWFHDHSNFYSLRNIQQILIQTVIVGIGAMGMTLIIIAGGIDLSVGSMIALVSVVVAKALQWNWNPVEAACLGVAAGLICGLLNGVLITGLRVVPFIVTLGTLLFYRGQAMSWADNQKIDAPETFLTNLIGSLPKDKSWMIFPPAVWIMFATVAGMAILLRYTRFGRHATAIGSNENTALLCGVRVPLVKVAVYSLGGLLVGLAGVMQFASLTVGDPTVAVGVELDIIAAVVIGGGSLNGGEGSAIGSLIGALIMAVLKNGCTQLGWEDSSQMRITAVILVVAVALDQLRHRKSA